MKASLLQISASDDPAHNLQMVSKLVAQAAAKGAGFILTPEATNCISLSRRHQEQVLRTEEDDPMLAGLRAQARSLGVWIHIGSLVLKTLDDDGRFANRSFLIAPDGTIAARYDKIHMFDATLSATETYTESAGFRPGDQAVIARTPFATLGLSICYDLRFPHLYRDLAKAGAEVLLVPAAFAPSTGRAHWEVLLRARAIETGCYVLAAAQTGHHDRTSGPARQTHGHSMVVSPWGEVLRDAASLQGILSVDIDLDDVAQARHRLPSLSHDRSYHRPRNE